MSTQSTTTTTTTATAPTGDIKVFIDAFNKDFDLKLKSLLDSQQNYKNVYADAIKIATPKEGPWPKDPKVITIGDLFKYTFPDIESDKVVEPPRPTINDYEDYNGWTKDLKNSKDEKIKTMYNTINSGIRSNEDIQNYQGLKKPGITNPSLWSPGQYYFDVFMSVMLSPSGPLKDPRQDNGGSDGSFGDFAKTHGGSVSVSFFDASGEVELSKRDDPADPKLDYYEFYEVLDSGYLYTGTKYKMSDITGVSIGLGDQSPSTPISFSSLKTQYRSGILSDLIKDSKFNRERGDIENASGKYVDSQKTYGGEDITGFKFTGNYEHILLYKAFIQAGDNYKSVVLPVRNPEEPKPEPQPATVLAKVVEPTATGEVQFKFNVEKIDTFIVVGGTVSPPLEFIIVPNDGTKYIIDTPDVFNDDDLGEEYKEGEFIGLQEQDMVFEVAESLGVGTEVEFPTPPLDPNTPPGPGSGTTGPGTYKEGNGMSAKEWESKGTMVIGSKVPSNLSGPAKYNQNVKLNKTMTNEYLPAIKGITGYTNGAKLLAIVMAQKEGFASGTRSYRTNNPGNIGNTDSGSNKTLKTLADGIKLQLDYITKVAKGQHTAYPIGKEKNMKPYYSPEIAKNNGPNGPYKGMTAYLPGYKFTYTGMIEQYCKIYATGARTGNSYITMIVSWYRQNGYKWVTEETTLAQLIEQNLPNSFA